MNPANDGIMNLSDRCVIDITGEDAFEFLQNIVTNDVRKADGNNLVYACLLMPQGFFLHEFFIGKRENGYFLDCETARIDDLLRRLTMLRLRAKVSFGRSELPVYAGSEGLADPRLPTLPQRHYRALPEGASPVAVYHDLCIALCVPCGTHAITPERDTMADVNLDLLNAVAWDKGCFIGQEVAARMYHRNIAKRRLVMLGGTGLKPGMKLTLDGKDAGEVRQVSSNDGQALAQVKSACLAAQQVMGENGETFTLSVPQYLPLPK